VAPEAVRSVTLEPLSKAATVELISSVYDLPAQLLSEVAETSGGNPLFALELAGSFDRTGGRQDRTAGYLMPDSIESLITSQIDQLGHDNRELVRTAAVLGLSFPVELLTDLLGRDISGELAAVDQLIAVAEGVGSFRSEVVASVAYGGLSGHRRAEVHGRVAAVLEEHRADISQLAWHHAQAGNHELAWTYSRRAAARAAELGMMSAAADHLQQAIHAADIGGDEVVTAGELTEVLEGAFQHCVAAKRYEEAQQHGERALARLADRLARAKLLIRLVTINGEVDGSYRDQVDRLNEELSLCAAAAEDAEPRAWLQATLAGMYYRLDDMAQALAAVDNAVADAERAGERGPLVPAFRIRQVGTDRGRSGADPPGYRARGSSGAPLGSQQPRP
jgi:predicted ATPase